MNWTKTLIAAVVGGIAMAFVNFVCHQLVLGDTYVRYSEVFSQEAANPIWFFVISIVISIFVAILFTKSRSCWPAGLAGGAQFGVLVGFVPGFTSFFWPLVIADFPYYLGWCWLGIDLIGYSVLGIVLAFFIKRT